MKDITINSQKDLEFLVGFVKDWIDKVPDDDNADELLQWITLASKPIGASLNTLLTTGKFADCSCLNEFIYRVRLGRYFVEYLSENLPEVIYGGSLPDFERWYLLYRYYDDMDIYEEHLTSGDIENLRNIWEPFKAHLLKQSEEVIYVIHNTYVHIGNYEKHKVYMSIDVMRTGSRTINISSNAKAAPQVIIDNFVPLRKYAQLAPILMDILTYYDTSQVNLGIAQEKCLRELYHERYSDTGKRFYRGFFMSDLPKYFGTTAEGYLKSKNVYTKDLLTYRFRDLPDYYLTVLQDLAKDGMDYETYMATINSKR